MDVVELPFLLENKINKKIIFSVEGLSIEKLSGFNNPVNIPAENIAAIRYGTYLTRGYIFAIGRQYYIELKEYNDKVHRIKLNSVYGIKNKTYYRLWIDIFDKLWTYYFANILNYYIELVNIQQAFEIAGVMFTADGIILDKKHKIAWVDIAISNYRAYFMIYDRKNYRVNKSCSFANDWNAIVLQSLVKSIVEFYKSVSNA